MVYGSLLKGLIRQLENSPWEQITMQGMYKWPSDTADLIPQLQDHVRSRGGEEQSHGMYIWTAGMLAQQQCSTKGLGQEVWRQYLGDHFFTCVHCLPPCWIWDWRTAATWLYGTGVRGNLRVKDSPVSGKKAKPFRYWKPADLASLSMGIWPWAWLLWQLFRARKVEWTQLSPQKIRGSKGATHILNFSSCPASSIVSFKHLPAVLPELNFWAKCSDFQAVTKDLAYAHRLVWP